MDEGLMRGPRAHSVVWTMDDDWLTGKITCHAAPGADCRLVCPEGCDEWDAVDHQHPLADCGTCNAATWIEEDGVLECHRGRGPVRDGFVQVEWTGGGYTWSWPPAEEEAS